MTTIRLLALALPCLLSSALAGTLDYDLIAKGDNGPAESGLTKIRAQEDLTRWSADSVLEEGFTYALVGLGEQPAGTEAVGLGVIEQDKYGWDVQIRVKATMPYKAKRKKTARPFVLIRFKGSPLSLKHRIRVDLEMDEVKFETMDLERAVKTRAKLAQMSRSQKRQVRELHDANLALRTQLAQLEQDVLAMDDDPAYNAAMGELDFRTKLTYAVEIASLQTDLQIFGTTANPMVSSGDESIKYLSKTKKNWSKELAKDYAYEAEYLNKAIKEMQDQLKSMRALAAKAPAAKPQRGEQTGLSDEVQRN